MTWMYKVCKKHIGKGYTVVGRHDNRRSAEDAARSFQFYDHFHKYFVKRYSEKEGIF